MLRASAAAEAAGVPSSTLVCEGFLGLAASTSVGLGLPNIPVAPVPGHTGVQSKDELRRNILDVTLDHVVKNLTGEMMEASEESEPGARDIVVRGSFDEVNQYFYEHELSDGLPIVPPTKERVEAFLAHTDRSPDEIIGIMLPDNRAATVWSVAVNGVMAGCKPEYMPVLIALIEAMADHYYGVEHSGNTPGGETLIVLNGPIIKELGFNYTQGVMRDGFMANTSVGRFWRLYLRNIAGFLPHKNDKATFGNTWRVVVAENEDVVKELGWEPLSVDMGFAAGDNTVTISRMTGGNHISSISGSTPEEMLPYLADAVVRQYSWQIMFTVGQGMGTLRPLVLLGPIIAKTIASWGWSKADLRKYLYDHARLPAHQWERILRDWTLKPTWNLEEEVRLGRIPKAFFESDDPNRMVPLVWDPDDYMIVVTGDPARNSAYVFAHNGVLGYPVAKKIDTAKPVKAGAKTKRGTRVAAS
ncbi:MAG TPA: UGSC family (seleno)protein [Burkholderiales bacterium]|nr:UGSC family (seleno)protein [Burkholderiales bacterium]